MHLIWSPGWHFSFTLVSSRPMLSEKPDIVVGTPTRLLAHIRAGNLSIRDSLEMVVIDEADLVFSFGYEDNVKEFLQYVVCKNR